MQDPNYGLDDAQGYELPPLPYIPYAPPSSGQRVDASLPQGPGGSSQASPGVSQSDTSPAIPLISTSPQAITDALPAVLRKRGRRRLWIMLGALVAVLLIGSLSAFALISYMNRPTPARTLDSFCDALQKEDYQTAYNQFTRNLQSKFTEASFAKVLSDDKVVVCSHGVASETGDNSTTSLKLVHSSKGVNNDMVMLTKEKDNAWKINDLQAQA